MELNRIFRSHMVLQANKPVNIFGSGDGTVKVEINGHFAETTANGDWVLTLPESDYSGPHTMKVTMNEETVILHDIYFGDVILLAGQSNLQFRMNISTYDKSLYKSNDLMRFFCSERPEEGEHFTPTDGWVICDAETVDWWSAVGYHLADFLNEETNHAIGIVGCYQGGSSIQGWLPFESLANTKAYIPFENRHSQYPWNKDGFNYDFMFKKLIPFTFKTVVWYQGESNRRIDEAKNYHFMLTTLIDLWRKDLKDLSLPFIVIQIHKYAAVLAGNDSEGWQTVQAAQVKIAETMENVYCVKSADVCEDNDIHPATKLHLAKRISNKILELG
ncbi:MAG: hypothetical protein IKU10_04640 [Clostridia bacterium]|nr:hypothetical protein [Clostridia bacterium]